MLLAAVERCDLDIRVLVNFASLRKNCAVLCVSVHGVVVKAPTLLPRREGRRREKDLKIWQKDASTQLDVNFHFVQMRQERLGRAMK